MASLMLSSMSLRLTSPCGWPTALPSRVLSSKSGACLPRTSPWMAAEAEGAPCALRDLYTPVRTITATTITTTTRTIRLLRLAPSTLGEHPFQLDDEIIQETEIL